LKNILKAVTKSKRQSRKDRVGQQHLENDKILKDSHGENKMSERNEFSAGLGAKVCGAVADEGGTPAELNSFSENPILVRQLLAVIRGTAKFVVTEVAKILRLVKSGITVPAVTEPFVVADHFQVNIGGNVAKPWKKGEVKIVYVGDGFKTHHLAKLIGLRYGMTLSCHELTENANDTVMRKELGAGIETDEASVWDMLKKQPEGGKGVLRTDGYANIFYIIGVAGVRRAVFVRWSSGGWDVSSYDLDDAQWGAGSRVFSRNS
jgi:hypothetical protein